MQTLFFLIGQDVLCFPHRWLQYTSISFLILIFFPSYWPELFNSFTLPCRGGRPVIVFGLTDTNRQLHDFVCCLWTLQCSRSSGTSALSIPDHVLHIAPLRIYLSVTIFPAMQAYYRLNARWDFLYTKQHYCQNNLWHPYQRRGYW